ncbi:MAG: hypothetical protein KDB14_32515 [Planctomycetales bacterium]|nr:hypothetical protein [Planctomycetales bacterium]
MCHLLFRDRLATVLLCLPLMATGGCGSNPSTEPARSPEPSQFEQASRLIMTHVRLDQPSQEGTYLKGGTADLERGVAMLESIIEQDPEHWQAHWLKGKAQLTLREFAAAQQSLAAAYRIATLEEQVAIDYLLACLNCGDTETAEQIVALQLKRRPKDYRAHSNAALTHLLAGRLDEAASAAAEARSLEPNDPIARNVDKIIAEVRNGKRPQPTSLPELR